MTPNSAVGLIGVGVIFFGLMGLAYLYAFMLGPAVRHLGKKFEQGRMDAHARVEWIDAGKRQAEAVRTHAPAAPPPGAWVQVQPQTPVPTPDDKPKYTITGRPIKG